MAEFGRSARVFFGIILVIVGLILIPTMFTILAMGGVGSVELILLPLFPMLVGVLLIISGLKGGGNE